MMVDRVLQEEVTADVQGTTEIRLRELALEEKKLATETRRMELEAEAQNRAADLELRKMELEMRKAEMEMRKAEADRETRRLEQHRGQEGGAAAGIDDMRNLSCTWDESLAGRTKVLGTP